MPIYEYQCTECEHILDALQKIDEQPLKFCPECGEPALKKLLSAPQFRLKGGGWYETDFKKDDKKRRNLAESDSSESRKAGKKEPAGSGGEGKKKEAGSAGTGSGGK